MLAEVVGSGVFPEHVIAPVREMISKAQFVMGQIEQIDLASKLIRCSTLAGMREFGYEHLVLALGQRANMGIISGMAEFALPLKLVGDAMYIRNRILQRLAVLEITHNTEERRSLGHFVIIGGGFSGVEVAGAVSDFIRSAKRFYPRMHPGDTTITLVHDGDHLLPELPESLGKAALRSLSGRGVKVILKTRAMEINSHTVTLANQTILCAETVICTIGLRCNPLIEALGLPLSRGRLQTAADGMVQGQSGLWAIGDCAALPNKHSGTISPPTAQFAVAQARQLASNLIACINGKPTQAFNYQSRGSMATTGHLKGVAQIFGIRLSGLFAWLAWRAYYLLLMPTPGRKVRIFVEWTWGMFFPLDITHLRFTRTGESQTDKPNPPQP